MFLDTVNTIEDTKQKHVSPRPETVAAYASWDQFPYTDFLHHGSRCCQAAVSWLEGTDRARLYGQSNYSGPRWLLSVYEWGPMQHPIYWCEAIRMKVLDCGGHAAAARTIFQARGLQTMALQIIQRYTADDVTQWKQAWEEKSCNPHWLKENQIYHEGCAVILPDDSLKLWDATSGSWLDPENLQGYGSIAAVKVTRLNGETPATRRWGRHSLTENQWMELR